MTDKGESRGAEVRLAIISVALGVILLCLMSLAFSGGDTLAMPNGSAAQAPLDRQPAVPPQPTAPPPPLMFTQELTRGGCLNEQGQTGQVVCNTSCLTTPLTVTVGLFDSNPLTSTYPVSAPFVAFGGFREIRVQGVDCSNPTCANLITAQFWYPTGAQSYKLWYWNPVAEQWEWVNQSMGTATYDLYLNTYFDCNTSVPALSELGAGLIFAWGYTTTAPVISAATIHLPIVLRDYTVP